MPIIEHQIAGAPDATAITICRLLTASPDEYISHIQKSRDFSRFIWACFFNLMEEVGYVPQPTGNDTKRIVCFVPLGRADDPIISMNSAESLARALKSVGWEADVEMRGQKLFFKIEGLLTAADVPVLDKRCILPSPVQFSHLMRPENEALTRLIWAFGENILRSKRKFVLGSSPVLWIPRDVVEKAAAVYQSRGWIVRPEEEKVAGRISHSLSITMPPQKALPAPRKTA